MKNSIIITLLFMFLGYGITSRGQATDIKKGDQAYEKKNYPEAILSYEKAFEKYGNKPVHNSGFIYKLANSYRFTNQYEKAIKYYNLIKENKSFPDAKMLLSDMLLRTGNINEARKELSTIPEITELIVNKEKKELIALQEKQGMTSTEGKNDQALLLLKNCYFADSCQKINNPEVTVQNIVTVNSKGSDFGLARLSEDTILFASNRISTEKSIVEGINYQPYTDFYTASKSPGSISFGNVQPLSGKINSNLNDGTFSRLGTNDWALITQCKVKPEKCRIYKVSNEGGKWTDLSQVSIENLPDDGFNYGHPAFSSDGKVYFASDRSLPGKAGKNIFMADYDPLANNLSNIRDVGDNINTDGDEMFPYVWRDSILFFSSTGRVGMGGLDIYWSAMDNGLFTNPKNLGFPTNSTADDFSVIVNDNLRGGYFCSNRDNDTQSDDIYYSTFTVLDPVRIRVLDAETRKPIENVSIRNLPDDEIKESFTKLTNKEGRAELKIAHLPCENPQHSLRLQEPHHQRKDIQVPCNPTSEIVVYMKAIDTPKYVSITGKVFDSFTKIPIDKAKVELLKGADLFKDTFTNKNGTFFFDSIPCNEDFTIIVSKDGYYSNKIAFTTPEDNGSNEVFDTGLIPLVNDTVITIGDIFYDFDRADLRPESVKILDTLSVYFNLTRNVKKIYIESHCDERGTDDYNMELSKRRGQSVFNYLVKVGNVDPARLELKNFGESRLKITNAKNDWDHQQNRRTDFRAAQKGYGIPTKDLPVAKTTVRANPDSEGPVKPALVPPGEKQQVFDQVQIVVTSSANPQDSLWSDKDTLKFQTGPSGEAKQTRIFQKEEVSKLSGITYRIQIAAINKKVDPNIQFSNIKDLISTYGIYDMEEGGLIKYMVGDFTNVEKADQLKVTLSARGFKGCFIKIINNK